MLIAEKAVMTKEVIGAGRVTAVCFHFIHRMSLVEGLFKHSIRMGILLTANTEEPFYGVLLSLGSFPLAKIKLLSVCVVCILK